MSSPIVRTAALVLALAAAAAACDETTDDDVADTVEDPGDPGADAEPDGDPPPADAPGDASGELPADAPADAPGDRPAGPHVAILEPADGAVVDNPVRFRIEASGVASVRLFADDFPLGDPWDPATSVELLYTFTGVGFERTIVLAGYDAGATEAARDEIRLTVRDPASGRGELVGGMWNTYYYFAREADYPGGDDTALYDTDCNLLARVPAEFSDDVCIEGSGVLEDGTVINYADTCSCGRPCPTGGTICYQALDPAEFPWGLGSRGNPLEPLRSWAVDNTVLPFGTVLYAEEWDGIVIPAADGLGGFVHDGCFRADDVGGAIRDDHFDFFAGTAGMWSELEDIFPTGSTFQVYRDGDRCAWLRP